MKAWITKYKRWLWWGAGMLALCAGVLLGLPAMMEPVPQEGVSLPVLTTAQEATDAFESFRAEREEEIIPAGTVVTVVQVSGVKLIVRAAKEEKTC